MRDAVHSTESLPSRKPGQGASPVRDPAASSADRYRPLTVEAMAGLAGNRAAAAYVTVAPRPPESPPPTLAVRRDPHPEVIRRIDDADKSTYPLSPGTFVFVKVNGAWQSAVVLGSEQQDLEDQRQEVAARPELQTDTTIDIAALRAASRAVEWEHELHHRHPSRYVRHRVRLLDSGGTAVIPYDDTIKLERSGFSGKFGIGTLQTAAVDVVTFGLGCNVIAKELFGVENDTANLVLKILGVAWGVPAGIVGARQTYVAFADHSVRGKLVTGTMGLAGISNLVSAASGIASNVVGLIDADEEFWSGLLFRTSAAAWSISQLADFINALAAFYTAYQAWQAGSGDVPMRVFVAAALAMKSIGGMTGGSLLTIAGPSGGLAVAGFITAVAASAVGGAILGVGKRKLKQD